MQHSHVTTTNYPSYIEKVVLFFAPDGSITMRIGNQHVQATPQEVKSFVENRLLQHARFAELLQQNGSTE